MWSVLSVGLGHFFIIAIAYTYEIKHFAVIFCSHGSWNIINTSIEQRSAQGGYFVMLYKYLLRKGHFCN